MSVVSPQAWIFHKGLTFLNRTDKNKSYKDLYGICYAASQLTNLSDKTILELKIMAREAPKWFKTFQKNLQEWVQEASPDDWRKLENQDPFGALRKPGFIRIIEKLVVDLQ